MEIETNKGSARINEDLPTNTNRYTTGRAIFERTQSSSSSRSGIYLKPQNSNTNYYDSKNSPSK